MPLMSGLHTCYIGRYKGCKPARVSESQKPAPVRIGLKLASMKAELLVIADRNAAVNTFRGLVHTARHTTKVGNTRSRWANLFKEAAVEGRVDDWGEVVTR